MYEAIAEALNVPAANVIWDSVDLNNDKLSFIGTTLYYENNEPFVKLINVVVPLVLVEGTKDSLVDWLKANHADPTDLVEQAEGNLRDQLVKEDPNTSKDLILSLFEQIHGKQRFH